MNIEVLSKYKQSIIFFSMIIEDNLVDWETGLYLTTKNVENSWHFAK